MRAPAALLPALAACGAGGGPPTPSQVDPGPPLIDTLTVECDAEVARWTLVVETTAWVGAVSTDWTTDGRYLEHHELTGVAFREDGTFERRRLRLDIVSDFRKQGLGRTAFSCAHDPDVLLVVRDLEGAVTDCRAIGPEPERWADLEGTGDCATPWP